MAAEPPYASFGTNTESEPDTVDVIQSNARKAVIADWYVTQSEMYVPHNLSTTHIASVMLYKNQFSPNPRREPIGWDVVDEDVVSIVFGPSFVGDTFTVVVVG